MKDRRIVDQVNAPRNGLWLFRTGLTPEITFLSLILIAELWVFSGAFHKFFTHDSLFYITNVPHSWNQYVPFLVAPSAEKSYRPLNLGFVALVRPFLGVDPWPYHWIPILFHLLNTWLFYTLAKRILPGGAAALAAAAFWGLHSVAGWITYDITYLSDFFLAFLLLVSLLLAVEGDRRRSRKLIIASLAVFVLSLMTKEAATTFPLAFWITLSLADLRASGEPASAKRIWQSFRRTVPLTLIYLFISCVLAGLFLYWLRSGMIYDQGGSSAYAINPWSNLLAKTKYIYWALNLPDPLSIPNAARNRLLAVGLMSILLLIWAINIAWRRGRLTIVEWAGLLWFAGLSVPAFLLSHRLAKWYLYLPLFGLALAFGVLVENLRAWIPEKMRRTGGLVFLAVMVVPILFSTRVQTRSYISASDSAYQSDLLQSCLEDFRTTHPTLPTQVTLYFLPAFEEGVSDLLSAPPIDHGELFGLYYPESRVRALFAHKGQPLPADIGRRSDIVVLQYFNGYLYDVTSYFKDTGRMTLYLLPTFEREAPPLLKKVPAGGKNLYDRYVQLLIADDGAPLPEDYAARRDMWILQYAGGRFDDVTAYYKGRHRDGARRVVRSLEGIQYSVNRAEFYPDYNRYQTPTGAPVFFQGAENEIFTQIGASTVVIPLHRIPADSRLRLEASWMYEFGDGGWAEAILRIAGKEDVVFHEYMQPDARRRSPLWKEITVDLQPFADQDAELILKCYNDPGRNTVADWLNWRDITIEDKEASPPNSKR